VASVELETLVGLEAFAHAELRPITAEVVRPGRLAVQGRLALGDLNALRSVVAAYLVEDFAVPRPRALLGQQHFDRVVAMALAVVRSGSFRTLRVSAAGADSSVLTRFARELASAIGLEVTDGPGDLLVAVRRGGRSGWQVLVRTSARPLSTRAWRVCDFPGALNATAAHAMARLSQPEPQEVFVNVACGSATLLIERLALASARTALGYDTEAAALDCARANVRASGLELAIRLERVDARHLPLDDGSVRSVVGDLPYAMLLGSSESNAELYPALVREAIRVLQPGGRLVLVTTQRRLIHSVIERFAAQVALEREVSFQVPHARGVINPSIVVLERL
jgi:tRNA (guanine6-N2)-methyltransferase